MALEKGTSEKQPTPIETVSSSISACYRINSSHQPNDSTFKSNTELVALQKAMHTAQMRLNRALAKQEQVAGLDEKQRQQNKIRSQRARGRCRTISLGQLEDSTSCSFLVQLNNNEADVDGKNRGTQEQKEILEQMERRKLLARLRAQRAREKKKKQADAFTFDNDGSTSSSSAGEELSVTFDTMCDTNLVRFKTEPTSGDEFRGASNSLQSTIELDPLLLIKEEPSEAEAMEILSLEAPSFASDFVTVEMKRIKELNAIPSSDEGVDNSNENTMGEPNDSTPLSENIKEEEADQEPTIDDNNCHSFNEGNPLDFSCDTKLNGEDTSHKNLLSKTAKDLGIAKFYHVDGPKRKARRAYNAERMRMQRAKMKVLETPEETMKRRELQRLRTERARLKKKAIEAGVLLDSETVEKSETEDDDRWVSQAKGKPAAYAALMYAKLESPAEAQSRRAKQRVRAEKVRTKRRHAAEQELNSCNKTAGVVGRTTAPPKIKPSASTKQIFDDSLSADFSCSSQESRVSAKRTRGAELARERRARETPEETEARRLKQRIRKMKSRLSSQLVFSEEELKAEKKRKADEMRLYRKKQRESETPEQAEERRQRRAMQSRNSRRRLEASETPEETAARKAASLEYCRKRLQLIKEKESAEEQQARIERERQYKEIVKKRRAVKNKCAKNSADEKSL